MRREAGSLAALVIAVALAGCLAPAAAPPEALIPASFDAGPRLAAQSALPLAVDRSTASLEVPPQWALGEWWTYEIESLGFGFTVEATRVVAGEEAGRYLVGMPADGFVEELMIFHFPGLGQVDRATLGFEAHDLWFQPLQFPLVAGATWTTRWYNGAEMEALVTQAGNGTATAQLVLPGRNTTLVYDAALGEIRSMEIENYLRYEVTGHGFGYEGAVMVPYAHDLVACHGRAAAALVIDGCGLDTVPRAPVEHVRIMGAYDRLSFALVASGLAPGLPVAPGAFSIQVTAPDGTEYALTALPPGPLPVLSVHGHDEPNGMWQVRSAALGAGSVLFEGAAYRALVADLG